MAGVHTKGLSCDKEDSLESQQQPAHVLLVFSWACDFARWK
jgi:hypothetical protein